MTEWIVKYTLYRPLTGEPCQCIDQFDDEGCLREFIEEAANDGPVTVWQYPNGFPARIRDVTDRFVGDAFPNQYDREASRADRARDEYVQGATV